MFLCSICKNKNFLYKCLGSFIQKFFFLWHKQQLLFKKIYKYPFFFFCTNIFSIPPPHLITFNCTLSYLIPRRELPPPSPVEHFVFTLSWRRQVMGRGGYPSWGVRAGRWRWRVEMVRVAPLRVRGRRAAFIVLLCWQVLAAWSGWRGDGLRIIVQVTGIALGRRCRDPSAGGIVTVTDICAAGRRGRCKMPVAVRPVAAVRRFMGKASAYRKTVHFGQCAHKQASGG